MKQRHVLVINAPLNRIFSAASDIARWPEFMPHYRYNRYISQTPSGGVVKSACGRLGITTTWFSKFHIDTQKHQMEFEILKSTFNAVRGMKVHWSFVPIRAGSVRVSIVNELPNSNWSMLSKGASDWILHHFFIGDISTQTLLALKRKVETRVPLPVLDLPPALEPKRLGIVQKQ
jgi:ribosome-associated toxin RatA of RatAB toxin-antitoxin module